MKKPKNRKTLVHPDSICLTCEKFIALTCGKVWKDNVWLVAKCERYEREKK